MKDVHNSERAMPREQGSRKIERSVGRATPTSAVEHHSTKRRTTYSTSSATDLYRNQKAGLAQSPAPARPATKKPKVDTTQLSTSNTSTAQKSSIFPLLGIFGAMGVIVAANYPNEFYDHPFLTQVRVTQNELVNALGLDTILGTKTEHPPEQKEDESTKEKSWLFWRNKK